MGLKFSRHGLPRTGDPGLVHVHNKLINFLSTSFYIRNLVSKQRRRMIVGGYDLDMTYITDRILAMSFPAERMRSVYRNPLWQVKSVLDMRHPEHYKVSTRSPLYHFLLFIGLLLLSPSVALVYLTCHARTFYLCAELL